MKKVLMIALLVMLIILFFQVNNLYALYKSQKSGDYEKTIGYWAIKLYTTDIVNGNNIELPNIPVDYIHYVSSSNVAENRIVPGGLGYFDIVIDPRDTDVSIMGTINMNTTQTSGISVEIDHFESYFFQTASSPTMADYNSWFSDNNNNKIENNQISSIDGTAKFVIPYSKIKEVSGQEDENENQNPYNCVLRVYFKWINNEENNDIDTEFGSHIGVIIGNNGAQEDPASRKINLSGNIKFTQYTEDDSYMMESHLDGDV